MKHLFFTFVAVAFMIGIGFYLNQNDFAISKWTHAPIHYKNDGIENIITTARKNADVTTSKKDVTTSKKKGCACCPSNFKSELEKVRQRRKALEVWAREMINTHGYEKGMRRVAAKSSILATRIQHLLKKEKNRATPSLVVE